LLFKQRVEVAPFFQCDNEHKGLRRAGTLVRYSAHATIISRSPGFLCLLSGTITALGSGMSRARPEQMTLPETTTPGALARHMGWSEIPAKGLTLFGREDGKPMTRAGLTRFMKDAIAEAGLPAKCVPHGLRKAGMRRMAEAGKTEKQIAAVSGHKSLREVQRYTEAADQRRLARDAMGNKK
jgi:integrase